MQYRLFAASPMFAIIHASQSFPLSQVKDPQKQALRADAPARASNYSPWKRQGNLHRLLRTSCLSTRCRPMWNWCHNNRYLQAADVPIVKLNPLNILTVKAEGEKELREVSR